MAWQLFRKCVSIKYYKTKKIKALPIRPYRGRKHPHPIGGRAQDVDVQIQFIKFKKIFQPFISSTHLPPQANGSSIYESALTFSAFLHFYFPYKIEKNKDAKGTKGEPEKTPEHEFFTAYGSEILETIAEFIKFHL